MTQRKNPGPFHAAFESKPAAVRATLEDLRGYLAQIGLTLAQMGTVEIVMAEVLNNVSRHAFGTNTPGPVQVSARLSGDTLHVKVRDTGTAMPGGQPPPGRLPDMGQTQDQLPEGGFGWYLIRDLTDSVDYTRKDEENRLDLRFSLSQTAE